MQVNDNNRSRKDTIVLVVVCLLLQVMLAPHIGMGNGRINFALIFVATYALSKGGRSAVAAGFLAGLIYDLLSTSPVGLMSGLLTLLGFALGTEERNRFADGFVPTLSVFGLGSFLVIFTYHLTMLLLGVTAGVWDLLMLRTLPSFALTFIAFIPFAYIFVRLSSKGRGLGGSVNSSRSGHYDVKHL